MFVDLGVFGLYDWSNIKTPLKRFDGNILLCDVFGNATEAPAWGTQTKFLHFVVKSWQIKITSAQHFMM